MLSLKDFKEYEISEQNGIEKIKGGISCAGVLDAVGWLYSNNYAQYLNVMNQYNTIGIQCTTSSGMVITIQNEE